MMTTTNKFLKELREFLRKDSNAKFIVYDMYERLGIVTFRECLSMLETEYTTYDILRRETIDNETN